jgi:hypothetical protein
MAGKRKYQPQKVNVHSPNKTKHTVDLIYEIPDDITLQYVDNLNIIHTETEFSIAFFQSQFPPIMAEEDWDKIRKVKSKCVARIVISPAKMPIFIDAMVRNWKRFIENFGVAESEDVSKGNDTAAADTESEG